MRITGVYIHICHIYAIFNCLMGNMFSLMKVMQEKTTCKKSGALKHLKEDKKISEMRVDAWNVSR